MNEIVRDNGIKSRKLWFSVFAVAMVLGGAFVAAHWPSLAPMYDTMVGGIVAITGLYLTGSVATKFVGTKAPPKPE